MYKLTIHTLFLWNLKVSIKRFKRYFAREFGLAGSDDYTQVRVDTIVDCLVDIQDHYIRYVGSIKGNDLNDIRNKVSF